MNNLLKISAPPTILQFNGKPIRVFAFADHTAPFFSLADICAAIGWPSHHIRAVLHHSFPRHGLRFLEVEGESGPVILSAVTPVGAWWWTDLIDGKRGEKAASWVKTVAYRLCPNPVAGDASMFLTPTDDGELPPRPSRYSGWEGAWKDLKYSDAYHRTKQNSPPALLEREALERLAEQLAAEKFSRAPESSN